MLIFKPVRRRQSGFSLIELMIALTAGLIIIGAVSMFTVATMRSYSENILSTLLTQELRTSMNLMVRELRRSGHDSTSVTRVLTDGTASTFGNLDVDAECIVYEYDRQVSGAGPDATEMRGLRWDADAETLQINATSASIDCASDDGWEDITNPQSVRITNFVPTLVESEFCTQLQSYPDPVDATITRYDLAVGSVKTISLCLEGEMVARDNISRWVGDAVRIRAEDLTFLTGETDLTKCVIASTAPDSPVDLNSECAP